jgi:hypothetical protein
MEHGPPGEKLVLPAYLFLTALTLCAHTLELGFGVIKL